MLRTVPSELWWDIIIHRPLSNWHNWLQENVCNYCIKPLPSTQLELKCQWPLQPQQNLMSWFLLIHLCSIIATVKFPSSEVIFLLHVWLLVVQSVTSVNEHQVQLASRCCISRREALYLREMHCWFFRWRESLLNFEFLTHAEQSVWQSSQRFSNWRVVWSPQFCLHSL